MLQHFDNENYFYRIHFVIAIILATHQKQSERNAEFTSMCFLGVKLRLYMRLME